MEKQGDKIELLLKSTSNEERQKIEIYSSFAAFPHLRYGYWINPVGKAGYRIKPIDFTNINIASEVPRTYMSSRLIMTAQWISQDYLSNSYSEYIIIGGILSVDIYEYPPLPRVEKDWTMKYSKIKYQEIKRLPYPNFEGQVFNQNYQNVTPVRINLTVKNDLFLDVQKIRVGCFDKTQGWITELINEIKYDASKRVLSFSTQKMAPLAILMNRCEDYPYKSWKLRSVNKNTARLDIEGRRLQLNFEIGPGYVQLLKDSDPQIQFLSLIG